MPRSPWAQPQSYLLTLVCLLSLGAGAERARGQAQQDPLYISPGVVYSALDDKNGGNAIGAELSVPYVLASVLGVGPLAQVQWTPRRPHYITGLELVYQMFALELGWFVHGSVHDGRQGFSATLLFGAGLGWIGARVSAGSDGATSWALNMSIKAPVAVRGCHQFVDAFLPAKYCRLIGRR
jgi:hypothetical protein